MFSSKKIWEIFWATKTRPIMSTKYILIIKLITWMNGKSRDELIKSN
jgi:hypothetical protein